MILPTMTDRVPTFNFSIENRTSKIPAASLIQKKFISTSLECVWYEMGDYDVINCSFPAALFNKSISKISLRLCEKSMIEEFIFVDERKVFSLRDGLFDGRRWRRRGRRGRRRTRGKDGRHGEKCVI